jgi:O-antigen/teichoic acid export membrane protein
LKNNSRKKATIWELIFYYLKSGIGIVKGILIIPLYLNFIDEKLFGAWLASGSILAWIQMFDPGTGAVLKQKIAYEYGKYDKNRLGLYIGSGILISSIIAVLILLTGYLLSFYLGSILNLKIDELELKHLENAFEIGIIGTTLTVISFSITAINKGFLQSPVSNKITLFGSLVGLGFNIFLLFHGYRLLAIAWGILINGTIRLIGNLVLSINIIKTYNIKIGIQKSFLKSFSSLFSYTFLGKIGTIIMRKGDLLIISRFIGQESVTAFELTRRPIRVMLGFMDKTSVSFMPAFSNLFGNNKAEQLRQVFNKYINYMIWGLVLISVLFIIFNESLLELWIGKKDIYLGDNLNALFVLALFMRSVLYNISNFTFSLGNIKGNSSIIILKSIIYITALVILVKLFGLIGAILALIISLSATELWYYPQKIKTLLKLQPFEKRKIIYFLLVPAIFVLCFILKKSDIVNIESWLSLIVYVSIFVIIYLGIFYLLNKEFRDDAARIISKMVKKQTR